MSGPDATNRQHSPVKSERPVRVDFRNRGTQSAVVFVHGLRGHAEETWGAFPQLLMEHGQLQEWDVFGIGYSSNLRLELARLWSADAPLDVLGYYLRTMLVLPPLDQYERVALVAHSMGGLVVQYALLDEETRKRISHAFLFGTPSAGVAKASMLQRFNLQTQDMLTGSEFIANLRAGWPKAYAGGKAFILRVIAGERDAFVAPDTSLLPFEDAVRFVVPGDHLSMVKPESLDSLSVQIVVRGLLQQPLMAEPHGSPLASTVQTTHAGKFRLLERQGKTAAKVTARRRRMLIGAAILMMAALAVGSLLRERRAPRAFTRVTPASSPAAANVSAVSEKSIAVLPFENLSEEKANAFFADGVQDEILTDLARIADLKVISRTSVMQYKSGVARNLREIGQQLGVAHVLEGSVQRSGNRVRVNAQLVDARTDGHQWGQTYDRDLADVFAIQSEIAKTIADQLRAKLSPAEKNAIERPPTSDITAFDLYTRGKNLILRAGSIAANERANTLQGIDLVNQAIARDPSFFDAYCQVAWAHDGLYMLGYDHTSARLALADAAVKAASRLRRDAGETHLARAQNLYQGYLDYDGALAELELARQTLPNDWRAFFWTGLIQRRQGRWEESIRNLERGISLDPRNFFALQQTGATYHVLRRYAEEKATYDRVLAFEPDDAVTKVARALIELNSKADTRPLHQMIDSIRAANPDVTPSIADAWLLCALTERDTAAAKNALIALGENPINLAAIDNVRFNRPFVEGVLARITDDDNTARSAFTAARAEQEKIVQAEPNYGPALCALGLIDAGLGQKEAALREGRRAAELLPSEKDALDGSGIIKYLAMIAAWVGDKDLACEQLSIAIRIPSGVSYGQLKLLPFWDPLRGDPRFEKLIEESKKPVALK